MKPSWLRRLFTRPRLLLRFDHPSLSASGVDCEQLPKRWFDYDNDNDTSNYVSEFDDRGGDDDDDDMNGALFGGSGVDVAERVVFCAAAGDEFGLMPAGVEDAFADTIDASSLDLVDRPEMAAKQSITFATTAKKVSSVSARVQPLGSSTHNCIRSTSRPSSRTSGRS